MAAGRLPAPGTEFGPCAEDCKHIECKQTRDMSGEECHYCTARIGYEVRFYQLPDKTLVHARCHEDALECESVPIIS